MDEQVMETMTENVTENMETGLQAVADNATETVANEIDWGGLALKGAGIAAIGFVGYKIGKFVERKIVPNVKSKLAVMKEARKQKKQDKAGNKGKCEKVDDDVVIEEPENPEDEFPIK